MPIYEAPCPPCKIILNGGFIAALSPILIESLPPAWPSVIDLAKKLATVTKAYTDMLAAVGVAIDVVGDWEGCAEARQILTWVGAMDQARPQDMADKIEAWTATYRDAIVDLATGHLPQ
jgi:hypothetical protein